MKPRVVVAMSGGVDSSTAAFLLKEQGYDVVGINLHLFSSGSEELDRKSCCGLTGSEDARRVADHLGIPFFTFDYRDYFHQEIINTFSAAYASGITPNPCIRCNTLIKFGRLLDEAKQLDAGFVATGHYCRVEYEGRRHIVRKGTDSAKDQSYFLYDLSQEQLSHIMFPLGGNDKTKTRELAKQAGLPVHAKPGSQEICFIPDNDYPKFLKEHFPGTIKPGLIVHSNGEVLGEHEGIAFYTIGQRRGMGIGYQHPLYVIRIDAAENKIIAGGEAELYASSLTAGKLNLVSVPALSPGMTVMAKIRYNHKPAAAIVNLTGNDRMTVEFTEPQRAITPGQSVVLYDNDMVLAGGTIISRGSGVESWESSNG